MYADKQCYQTLQHKFATLRQTSSASKFAAEFKSLANILGINQEARLALFTERLKGDVQKNLALVRDITTFDELVNAAVHIDHVNYTLAKAEAKAESKSSTNKSSTQGHGKGNPTSSRPPQSRPDNASSLTSHSTSHASSTPNSTSPRNPLSQEEKERREALGLCRFCGGNHFKRDCPSLKAKLARDADKGAPPRYPTPASTSNVNSAPSGKFPSQSQ